MSSNRHHSAFRYLVSKSKNGQKKITIVATPEYQDIPMCDQVPGEGKHLLLACNNLAKFYEDVWTTRELQ